jgi:hypothetical protein
MGERVGYNDGMKKKFGINTLNNKEIEVIKQWTEDSSEIKTDMWTGKNTETVAALFGMFDKYSSNVVKHTKLYRGMSVPDTIFFGMGYDKLSKGDPYTPDDKAISSFSMSKVVAVEYAADGVHSNKVIIRIESHAYDMFDISDFSAIDGEEETILTKNIWYTVHNIKRIKQGEDQWLLLVLKKQ